MLKMNRVCDSHLPIICPLNMLSHDIRKCTEWILSCAISFYFAIKLDLDTHPEMLTSVSPTVMLS